MAAAKQYTQNHFPMPREGEWFTKDVLAMDENGNTYLVFYNFDMSCWLYSEGSYVSENSVPEGIKFNWIDIPDYLTKPE